MRSTNPEIDDDKTIRYFKLFLYILVGFIGISLGIVFICVVKNCYFAKKEMTPEIKKEEQPDENDKRHESKRSTVTNDASEYYDDDPEALPPSKQNSAPQQNELKYEESKPRFLDL